MNGRNWDASPSLQPTLASGGGFLQNAQSRNGQASLFVSAPEESAGTVEPSHG